MYQHYHIASRLAERLKGRTGLSALAFALCIKMLHVSSVLVVKSNPEATIAKKMGCSRKTARKVLDSALELGLVCYDKKGNIVAERLYNTDEFVEIRSTKYGDKKCVNVITVNSENFSIQNVRKQIEDAMIIKSIEYSVRKENAQNSSTIAKVNSSTKNVRTAKELTLQCIADRLSMTPQNICKRVRELAKRGLISIKRIPAYILCNVNYFDGKKKDVFVSNCLVVASQHNEYAITSVNAYRIARNRILNYFDRVKKVIVGNRVIERTETPDLTMPMATCAYVRMGLIDNNTYDL